MSGISIRARLPVTGGWHALAGYGSADPSGEGAMQYHIWREHERVRAQVHARDWLGELTPPVDGSFDYGPKAPVWPVIALAHAILTDYGGLSSMGLSAVTQLLAGYTDSTVVLRDSELDALLIGVRVGYQAAGYFPQRGDEA